MSVSFAEERFSDIADEIRQLLARHWREIARHQDSIALDPDWPLYAALAASGTLAVMVARDAGRMVGYAVYFVRPHLHYRGVTWATSDIFWLAPEARAGMTGLRLFRFAEAALRRRGAVVMHTTHKLAHPAAGRLLAHLGHTPIERGYSKLLAPRSTSGGMADGH